MNIDEASRVRSRAAAFATAKRRRLRRIKEMGYVAGVTCLRFRMRLPAGTLRRITSEGFLLIDGGGDTKFSPFKVWEVQEK